MLFFGQRCWTDDNSAGASIGERLQATGDKAVAIHPLNTLVLNLPANVEASPQRTFLISLV